MTDIDSDDFSTRPSRLDTNEAEADKALETLLAGPHSLQVENIVSLRAFIEYIVYLPLDDFGTLDSPFEILRQLLEGVHTPTNYIGSGHSFDVHAISRPRLPPVIEAQYPQSKVYNSNLMYVVKTSRTVQEGRIPSMTNINIWRNIAWECHVLTHTSCAESPNIVNLLGLLWRPVTEDDEVSYHLPLLAVEYADQGSLEDLFQAQDFCIHLRVKKQILIGVAAGLQDLHAAGIIHADVKAGNVLLFNDNESGLVAKISDFGFATHFSEVLSNVYVRGFSPPWDAPEIRDNRVRAKYLPQVDIYSFGLLTWRVLLDGATIFDSDIILTSTLPDGFQRIAKHEFQSYGWLNAIQALKSDVTNAFLYNVVASIAATQIPYNGTERLLSLCLRQDPADRASRISELLSLLYSDTEHSPADYPASWDLTHNHGTTNQASFSMEARTNKGVTYNRGDLPDYFGSQSFLQNLATLHGLPLVQNLPPPVRHQLARDYRQEASNDLNPRPLRAWSAFNYVLSNMLAYDRQGDREIMYWMKLAADLGSLEAQALLYRFESVLGTEKSHSDFVTRCLSNAALEGSTSALQDLKQLDHNKYEEIRKQASRKAPLQPGIRLDKYKYKDKVLRKYFLGDCATLSESLHSRFGDAIPTKLLGKMLRYAATFNLVAALDVLISDGADVNSCDRYGKTALIWACQNGCRATATRLLECGANPKIKDWVSATSLHYAVYFEDEDVCTIVRALVEAGADLNRMSKGAVTASRQGIDGGVPWGTPLHWAVVHHKLCMVQTLLNLGADCMVTNGLTGTVEDMQNPIMRHTLDGDKYHPTQSYERSSLEYAFRDYLPETIEVMLRNLRERKIIPDLSQVLSRITPVTRLSLICLHGDKYQENFERTIALAFGEQEDTDINSEYMGQAIRSGSIMLVDHLLERGYSPNSRIGPLTPLHISLQQQHGEISLSLLRHGADPCQPSPPDSQCYPPHLLFVQSHGTHVKGILKEMIAQGADCGTFEAQYELLLSRAILDNWQDVISFLFKEAPGLATTQGEAFHFLVSQNSTSSLTALTDYLKCAKAESRLPDPVLHAEHNLTIYHSLLVVEESVRDDEVNRSSLAQLLKCYPSLSILNLAITGSQSAIDSRLVIGGRSWPLGFTALNAAVSTGNAHGVAALLKAGASSRTGSYPPLIQCFYRLLSESTPPWVSETLGGRRKRARRFYRNSIDMALAFLRHEVNQFSTISLQRGRDALERCLPKWKAGGSRELLDSIVCQLLVEVHDDTSDGSESCEGETSPTGISIHGSAEDTARGLIAVEAYAIWEQFKVEWTELMTEPNTGLRLPTR